MNLDDDIVRLAAWRLERDALPHLAAGDVRIVDTGQPSRPGRSRYRIVKANS